jgi:hypothetical protein
VNVVKWPLGVICQGIVQVVTHITATTVFQGGVNVTIFIVVLNHTTKNTQQKGLKMWIGNGLKMVKFGPILMKRVENTLALNTIGTLMVTNEILTHMKIKNYGN